MPFFALRISIKIFIKAQICNLYYRIFLNFNPYYIFVHQNNIFDHFFRPDHPYPEDIHLYVLIVQYIFLIYVKSVFNDCVDYRFISRCRYIII